MSLMLCSCLFAQDEETETLLSADFEIGHFIRERIVPRAVLYFTGEAIEDDEVREAPSVGLCMTVVAFGNILPLQYACAPPLTALSSSQGI